MNIAVIPARGGSKRIPRKNIREFCGKPIVAWPIEIAKKSNLFERIIVSTNDDEIAEVSKAYGAQVPFMRSEKLSDDFTETIEVISNVASWIKNKKWKVDALCCIYPTSVFLRIEDLNKGFEVLINENWSYVFAATNFEYPITRSFYQHTDGGVNMFYPENFNKRSQDLPLALHDAAQFYWGRPDAWINNLRIFERHSFPIKIPNWRVQDIDNENDWKRAESLFKMLKYEV